MLLMNALLLSVFVVVLTVPSVSTWEHHGEKCSHGMIWNGCPSACSRGLMTCEDFLQHRKLFDPYNPIICTQQCLDSRCECAGGQVLGPDGFCVSTSACIKDKVPDPLPMLVTVDAPKTAIKDTSIMDTKIIDDRVIKRDEERPIPIIYLDAFVSCSPTEVRLACSSCRSGPKTCDEYYLRNDKEYQERKAKTGCQYSCHYNHICECLDDSHVYSPDRKCIPPELCPPDKYSDPVYVAEQRAKCTGGMIWARCGNLCNHTCESFHSYARCEETDCGPPRCQCPVGEILFPDGTCKPPDLCYPERRIIPWFVTVKTEPSITTNDYVTVKTEPSITTYDYVTVKTDPSITTYDYVTVKTEPSITTKDYVMVKTEPSITTKDVVTVKIEPSRVVMMQPEPFDEPHRISTWHSNWPQVIHKPIAEPIVV